MKNFLLLSSIIALLLSLAGCGEEGPLGNTPPQGRPDWMKDKKAATP
jgi:predicted small lipoprotein YifL